MKVLVLHTLPPEDTGADRISLEFDLDGAACHIAQALPSAVVAGVHGEVHEVLTQLAIHQPDVVFNLCEAPLGRVDREAQMAALFESLEVRFTGCGSETLALCRRKDRASAVLAAAGVAVPRSGVFPCIVKPADEDGSAGIFADSVCEGPEDLARARRRLTGPVVIQEFLPGREFAVALWGRDQPEYFSVGESQFLNGLRLNTYAAKWEMDSLDFAHSSIRYDTRIEPPLSGAIVAAARGAWHAVEAHGYLQVDVRLDGTGAPHVLDVNPNPEIGPEDGICRAAQEAGWTWEQFIRQQVEWA
ncbi:MAG TPA: ATP-grasp domain-containing protein [Bryobacteraceae bacterium]